MNVLFLAPTDKVEVIRTVNSCGNKYLADCGSIMMSLVKNVIECISEPMTHICNLSFKCGIFPHKMKTAIVLPLYKSGKKHLPTTGQFHFYHSSLKYWRNCLILNLKAL